MLTTIHQGTQPISDNHLPDVPDSVTYSADPIFASYKHYDFEPKPFSDIGPAFPNTTYYYIIRPVIDM